MTHHIHTGLVVFGLAFLPSIAAKVPASPQAGDGWIGKRVVQKFHDLSLRINDELVDGAGKALRFYRVEQVDGRSLLLKAEGEAICGWASASQVISADEAIDFFTKQLSVAPEDAFSYAMLAVLRHDKHELEAAIRNYNEAIRLDPQNARTLSARGSAWLSKKEHGQAIADFDEAIRLDPKNTLAYIGRGKTSAARKQYTQAIADFSEAVWLDPLAISAYDNRGLAWQSKKEYAKAIVDFNLALRLDPRCAVVYRHRGGAREAQESYSKADADYKEAIRLAPDDPAAYVARAWLLATCPDLRVRDPKLAVLSATKACELTGWKKSAELDTLAAVYAAAEDFESAVNWQTKSNTLARSPLEKIEGEARLKRYLDKKR